MRGGGWSWSALLACAALAGALASSAAAQHVAPHDGFGDDVVILNQADLLRSRSRTKMATARFVADEGNYAVVELAGDYNRDLADGSFNIDARVAVAEAFYDNHDDVYDFLVVFSLFEFETPGARAFYLGVRNDVGGIGQPIFDNAAFFGPSKRLQGYIDLAAYTRYELDSLQPDFDSTLDTMLHEIMHRWGIYARYQSPGGQPSADWLGYQDAHWSQYVNSEASVMGGGQWRDNGDGTFTALDIRRGYSDVDRYLAGFLNPEPALSQFYIRNADGDPEAYWPIPGDVTGGIAEQITIGQIIDAEGPRMPPADQAQKEFRAGFIVLVRPGSFPGDSLLAGLNQARTGVAERFGVETRGRGILHTMLAAADPLEVSDPDIVNGGSPANGLADFAAAVDWLLAAQDPAGFWGDRPATRLRDTALALRALELLAIEDPALLLGRSWLRSQVAQDNDDRAWLLASRALAAADLANVAGALTQAQNTDGGWGLADGGGSSAYDTALILGYLSGDSPAAGSAVDYLSATRRDATAWGALEKGSDQVMTTALALQALARAGVAAADLQPAADWLVSSQLGSGTFGAGVGSAHETALALNALGLFSAVPATTIESASVALEGLQAADGSWSGSVYSTALAIDALRNRQNPNLAISGAIQILPVAPRDGDLVNLRYTVTNAGLFNTPAVVAQAFLGDPLDGGLPIASPVPVPALQPGDDLLVESDWDTFGLAGEQVLFVRVDSTEQLAESSEGDNQVSLSVLVATPPAAADLAPLGNSLNFSPMVIGSLPTSFQTQVSVRNLGNGNAPGSIVALQRRQSDGQWITLGSESVDLPARTTVSVNLAAQLTQSGQIQMRVAVDPDDAVSEADESNNLLDFEVATADALDLAVLPSEMQLLTAAPSAGQDVQFQFVLRNLGTVDAPPVTFTAAVEQGGTTQVLLEQTVQLAAGASDPRNLAWRATSVGAAQLLVTIDTGNQAIEGDESNNQGSLEFIVGTVSQPNLAVASADLTFSPNPGLEGQPLLIEIPVSNPSDVAAGAFRVEVYDGVPGDGGTLVEGQDFAGLAAGGQQLVQVTTAPLAGGGQRLYYVTVDPANQVVEFNETDNTAFDQVNLLRLPDLAVTAANVILAPTLPIPGAGIEAAVTVDNLGQQPANDVAVSVFEIAVDGSQRLVGGPSTIASIAADSSAAIQFDWTFDAATAGVAHLLVVVDPDDTVVEISAANNQAEVRTDLQNQSFFVSERYLSPNGDGVKDVTAIGYALESPDAAASITIEDTLGRQVRGFAALTDARRGQVLWDGRSDRGSVVRDGNYQARLLDVDGGLLGQTLVVVDTNRLPLLDAVGTPAAYYTDLRCSVESISSPRFSADGRYVYTSEVVDLNGDDREGLFRVPTRGRGLDQLLSDTFLSQLNDGSFISNVSPLADGRLLFTNGTGCGNCARRLWLKATPLAQPVQLDIGSTTQFVVLHAGPQYALIDDQDGELWKVFYQASVPPEPLQIPVTNLDFRSAVQGGWLMTRYTSGDYFGQIVNGQSLYYISADPGVAYSEIIFGPEVSLQTSPDGRYVAAFASENEYNFSAPAAGLVRAARLTAATPEIYFEQILDLGDLWDVHVALARGNQLLILNGINATVQVFDPSGNPVGEVRLPTQLLDDYADAVPPDEVFGDGPTEPFTRFASWDRWLDDSNPGRAAVVFSSDTNEFLVELALVYPEGGGEKSAQKRVPYNTHVSQYFRLALSDLEPRLVGTVGHEADESIIFPGQLEMNDPYRLEWLAREDRLLFDRSSQIDTLQLEPESLVGDLQLGRLDDAWPRRDGAMYKKLALSDFVPPDTLKCAGLGEPTPILESADNLIAHLQVSRFASVIELNGVASDRHLQSYQLDWARSDEPTTWFTLTSASNETIVDDLLATWVPPEAGSFLVRLRVTDLAGNMGEDVRPVSWLQPANLASVQVEPRYLSPNGDGVADELTLSFRVLRPINLDATVENASGQVVRTISGQYPTVTGDTETLTWDGRNNSGFLVPEGTYLMRVENRRFRIVVDITPPQLELMLPRAYQPHLAENDVEIVAAKYQLVGLLREANLDLGLVEFRRGNEPWNELRLYTAPPKDDKIDIDVDRDLFVPAEFRLTATDLAGNRAQIVARNQFEDLIVKELRQVYFIRSIDVSRPPEKKLLREPLEYREPPILPADFPRVLVPVVSDRIALTMDLTFVDPVTQYYIELAEPGNLNDWAAIATTPAPVSSDENYEPPSELSSDYRHLFLLPLADLQGLDDVFIRIRAEVAGVSYYSNGLRLTLDPGLRLGTMRGALAAIAEGTLEPEQDVDLVLDLKQLVPLKEPAITQIYVRESVVGLPVNSRLLVQSFDDARYLNETAFLPVTATRLLAPSEFSAQMFEVPTSPCRNYSLTWEADFPNGIGGLRPVRLGPSSLSRSCLSINTKRYAAPGAFCAETSPRQVQIRVKLETEDPDILPISLDVFDRNGAGEEVLIANVVAPQVGRSYPLDIGLDQLLTGQRALRFVVVDSVGDVTEERVFLPVDRQRPQLALDFPAEGQQLCAVQGPGGAIQLPLEGFVSDDFDGEFTYKARLGSGHDTPQLQLVGGTPDQLEALEISCSLDQPYLREECLQERSISGELGLYDYPDEHMFELQTGPTTAVIEAMDWSGERYCAVSRFQLDASVDARLADSFGLFSPNSDGVLDSVEIAVQALEPLLMSVSVHPAVANDDGGFDLGPALAQLASGLSVEGEFNFEWLGDDGSSVLPDGRYGLQFEFTDNCGLVETLKSVGEIDNTPPLVRIDYPLDNDPVGAIVEVLGRFTDKHFLSANVDYGSDDVWINLQNHQRQVVGRRIATWVLTGLEAGPYNLRAQARDRAGNEAEAIVSLQIEQITSLIWALQAEPPYISPNDDGVQDASRIGLGVQNDGRFTVEVRTAAGALVRRLANTEQLPAGSHGFEWDGRNSAGDVVADGDYVVRVVATDVAQSGFSQTEEIGLTVDTVAPDLFLIRPSGEVVQGRGTYLLNTDDENFATIKVWEQPVEPAGPEVLLLEEFQPGRLPAGDLSALPEGRFAVRLLAADLAGNQTEIAREFVVDNTAPEAELFSPRADDLLGGANPLVPITGRVSDTNFEQFELAVRLAGSMDPWQVIAGDTTIPIDELLANWNATAVADGDYSLRLVASDHAGLSTTVTVVVNVDNTPPTAIIAEPATESVVALGAVIRGTATDTNFKQYRLRVADALPSNPIWSNVAIADGAISNGLLLEWNNPPPDGRYRLELVVDDAVGLSSSAQITVLVDLTPPEPPTNLRAQVQPGFNVRLDWDAGSAPDLAGYIIYRNGAALNSQPVTPLNYIDPDVPEGEHEYHVVAVDSAGNQSDPTNTAVVTIDRTPPEAVLITPAEDERVRGLVSVVGTAASADDFFEYRVYVRSDGDAAPGSLLIQSPTAVSGEQLVVWDASSAAQEQTYILRLEAEDTSGNVGSDERQVVVDNLAPAAPTGLTAALQGSNDGALDWNPNIESDLAGYLLYRNGQLVNSGGDGGSDLLAFALTDVTYLDLALADGTQTWQVFAIDLARNISAGSNTAQLLIETGPPHAVIVEPDDGSRFEQPLRIVADSADLDIERVQFDYRAVGDPTWTALGPADTDPAYQATLDAQSIGLAFGDFQIRAVATDTGGLTDPAPETVNVTYADLTAPADPFDLSVAVNGGEVALSWQHADPGEVDEFLVYRRTAGDVEFEEWDAVAGPDLAYTDSGVADGDYDYHVTAVDEEFNESGATGTESAVVHTPQFAHPFTPTRDDSVVISGQSRVAGTINGQIQTDTGTTVVGPVSTSADGGFDLGLLPLVDGENTLEFRVTDAAGNISKPGIAVMKRGGAPSAPINPAVAVSGFDVTFSWDAPPEPNVVGYRPFRDGQPLLEDEALGASTWLSSSFQYYPANRAGDGNNFTYWLPQDSDLQNSTTTWIEAGFDQPALFTEVSLYWTSGRRATDYAIEAWSGNVWVPVARVTQPLGTVDDVPLVAPYFTDRLRLVVLDYDASRFWPVRLGEFQFVHRPLEATTQYAESRPDGVFDYAVSAVNDLGFEGPLSAIASAEVGDTQAPPAVVLTGSVAGSDALLSWTESIAIDLAEYRLLRDGTQILVQTELSIRDFADVGLVNGTYRYEVLAVDAFGNVSDPSNSVELTIDVNDVLAPQNLAVSAVPGGGALDLSWQPGAGPAPAGYRVRRALQSGGPYTDVADTSATDYRDSGLTNGTTYFYVVHALDAAGNLSAPSNQASGRPLDDSSPPAPVLQSPTVAGTPVTIAALATDVAGVAEPGVGVELRRNGILAGTVTSAAGFELEFEDLGQDIGNGQVSPDGRYIARRGYPDSIIRIPSGQQTTLEANNARMVWAADSASVYAADYDFAGELRRYSVDGQLLETIVDDWSFIDFGVPSPDNQRFLISGRTVNPATGNLEYGIWFFDRGDGSLERLGSFQYYHVSSTHVDWTSDSGKVVFVDREGVYELQIYDAQTGVLQVLQADVYASAPSISRDDLQVAYTAQGPGSRQIFVASIAGGVASQVSDNLQAHEQPYWSLGDRYLGYRSGCCEVFVSDLLTGGLAFSSDVGYIQDMRWLDNDQFYVGFGSEYATVVTPGYFRLRQMPLVVGDNEVIATAFDDVGNFSPPSAAILIQVPDQQFPDLAIGDLSVLPAGGGPGDIFQVGLVVRNVGQADAPAADISLRLLRPDGDNEELIAQQGPVVLAAGGQSSFSVSIGPLDMQGSYRLVAVVDPDNRIGEGNESNNLAETSLLITDSSLPLLTLRTERGEFAPGEEVTGTVELYNPGPTFSGRVEVTAEDQAGFEFNFNQSTDVDQLAFAEALVIPVSWNPGSLYSGTYRLRARLFDQNGLLIQQATREFAIGRFAEMTLTLTTTQSNYQPGTLADFAADLQFVEGNVVVDDATVNWQAIAPSGAVVWSASSPLGTMVRGFRASLPQTWPVADAATGTYRVRVELDSVDAFAEAELLVNVVDPAAELRLTGTVAVDAPVISIGRLFDVAWSVENSGSLPADGVPVSIRLLRTGGLAQLLRDDASASLAPGQRLDSLTTWDSTSMRFESYLIVLSADLSAVGGSANTILDSASVSGIDATPPVVSLLSPAVGAVTNADVQVRARSTDALSAVERVAVRVDGGEEAAMGVAGEVAVYERWLFDLPEGEHTFGVRSQDVWGNQAESAQQTFTVDRTPPVIAIAGVSDGDLLNVPVQPVVTVTDDHPDVVVTRLNGQEFAAGVTIIDSDGDYLLTVAAVDQAGNRSQAEVSFVLDFTAPQVDVTFPAPGAVLQIASTALTGSTEAGATVSVAVNAFVAQTTADAAGQFSFANLPLVAGENLLVLSAVDPAGNQGPQASLAVVYEVPTIAVSGSIGVLADTLPIGQSLAVMYTVGNDGNIAADGLPVRLQLVNAGSGAVVASDPVTLDVAAAASVQGSAAFATADLSLGLHRIELQAQLDGDWSTLDMALVTIVDETPPLVALLQPMPGSVNPPGIIVAARASDVHSPLAAVEYLLDQAPAVAMLADPAGDEYRSRPSALAHGQHLLVIQARDTAGNVATTAATAFSVDALPPVIEISGVDKGGLYNNPVVPVVTVSDDNLENVTITLDGQAFASGASVTTEGIHLLEVEAVDVVGNSNMVGLQFEIDLTGPAVTIESPTDGASISGRTVDVVVTTEANAVVTLVSAGDTRTLPASGTGQATFPGVPVLAGVNTVTLAAVDRAGNQGPESSVVFNGVASLFCAFGGGIGAMNSTLESDFKGDDQLTGTLTIDLVSGRVSELTGLLGDYPFSAVANGPTVGFENNLAGRDRVRIGGAGQFVGATIMQRSLTALEIELIDDQSWIESLAELDGQVWEQRETATWTLLFSANGQAGSSPAGVEGSVTGFCTTDEQIVVDLEPLILTASVQTISDREVDIVGQTRAGATVTLTRGAKASLVADANGRFRFAALSLQTGLNTIELVAVSGNQTSNRVSFALFGPAAAIPALSWAGLLVLILLTGLCARVFVRRPNFSGDEQ